MMATIQAIIFLSAITYEFSGQVDTIIIGDNAILDNRIDTIEVDDLAGGSFSLDVDVITDFIFFLGDDLFDLVESKYVRVHDNSSGRQDIFTMSSVGEDKTLIREVTSSITIIDRSMMLFSSDSLDQLDSLVLTDESDLVIYYTPINDDSPHAIGTTSIRVGLTNLTLVPEPAVSLLFVLILPLYRRIQGAK